jgi:hypothetical protein
VAPSKPVLEGLGGYLVSFRHPDEIVSRIEEFASRITETVPGIAYDSKNAHTSISDYGLQSLTEGEFSKDRNVLRALADSLVTLIDVQGSSIEYPEWLYNRDSVIVAGRPSIEFFEISERVQREAARRGLELRTPWGSHIIAVRFTEQRTSDELEDFFKLMQEAPNIGTSALNIVEVGHYILTSEGFDYQPFDRVNLLE